MTVQPSESHFESKNMLWLEVTNFCNLACTHCYNASGPAEPLEPAVSTEQYREILRETRDMGFRRIQFIGGEPLFYPHLKTLVDQALALGFDEIEIFSNLTTLPAWLFEEPYRSLKIATSLYSDDSKVHDKISATKGSFDRTVASLKRLVAAGFAIRAGFIEMGANKGQFERTREFLKSIGVDEVGYDAVREFGRADQNAGARMEGLCGHCSQGNLCIDVNGNVSGCIMSKPWAFGNVRSSSLRELFDSDDRRKFAHDLREIVRQRDPFAPTLCNPYYQGNCAPQCAPSCGPQQSCNPCSPLGSGPCNPNGRCSPYDKK